MRYLIREWASMAVNDDASMIVVSRGWRQVKIV